MCTRLGLAEKYRLLESCACVRGGQRNIGVTGPFRQGPANIDKMNWGTQSVSMARVNSHRQESTPGVDSSAGSAFGKDFSSPTQRLLWSKRDNDGDRQSGCWRFPWPTRWAFRAFKVRRSRLRCRMICCKQHLRMESTNRSPDVHKHAPMNLGRTVCNHIRVLFRLGFDLPPGYRIALR